MRDIIIADMIVTVHIYGADSYVVIAFGQINGLTVHASAIESSIFHTRSMTALLLLGAD